MRAVVTGGAGFLGSHLCTRLIGRGDSVVCADSFLTGDPDNVAQLANEQGFELMRVDVTESLDVDGPVDLVLHFASPASPVDYAELPLETLRVGSAGTEKALELARDKGARFLLASTSEVYGDPEIHPQPEGYWGNVNPIGPRSVYDEAKRYAEALTSAYSRMGAVDTRIVRIFNTYGPRMRMRDGRAVPAFLSSALEGQPLVVHGDGSQTRSLCYVDDLVDGILALAASGHTGPVNIGNPHEMTVLELAKLIIDVTGSRSPIEFGPRPTDDPTHRRPDITLARSVLGWQPSVEVEEGLRRTVDWFAGRIRRASA
ncbi:MAG TPA: UDP-glucuronic acid decarboxylase family protein [Actinomycetota bacterium]|nr:UDP-glucuronic acid decarboxylase family protein [Actinomycetota bacterium]